DWHLLVGDESALPAIAAAVEALPAGAVGQVIVEGDSADHQLELPVPDGVDLTWLHRSTAEPPARDPQDAAATIAADTPLARAVRRGPWPAGPPHALVDGEAHTVMRAIRPEIRSARGVPADRASTSGYSRRGLAPQGFSAWKSEFKKVDDTVSA